MRGAEHRRSSAPLSCYFAGRLYLLRSGQNLAHFLLQEDPRQTRRGEQINGLAREWFSTSSMSSFELRDDPLWDCLAYTESEEHLKKRKLNPYAQEGSGGMTILPSLWVFFPFSLSFPLHPLSFLPPPFFLMILNVVSVC